MSPSSPTLARLGSWHRIFPWSRGVVGLLLASALFAPALSREGQEVALVYLVDVSDSVSEAALDEARAQVQQAWRQAPPGTQLELVTFARRPRRVLPASPPPAADQGWSARWPLRFFASSERPPPPRVERHGPSCPADGPCPVGAPGSASNLQAAMQLAQGLFAPGRLRRMVLLSDGLETEGEALAEAVLAYARGVRIFASPPLAQARTMPPATLAPTASGTALPGRSPPASEEELPSVGRVLHLAVRPDPASPLLPALRAEGLEVVSRPPAGLPSTPEDFDAFDFLVLADLSPSTLDEEAQGRIARWVREQGGGLLVAAGGRSYARGGWTGSTIEGLLPLGWDGEHRRDMASVALSVVLDLPSAQPDLPLRAFPMEVLHLLVQALAGGDLVEVLSFDGEPTRLVPLQPARSRERIASALQASAPALQSGPRARGLLPTLEAAEQDLARSEARRKHVLLLTSAPTSELESEALSERVGALASQSITLSIVSLDELRDEARTPSLHALAELGGGRYLGGLEASTTRGLLQEELSSLRREAGAESAFHVAQVGEASFLRGLDLSGAPELYAYVSTRLRPAPAEALLESDAGEPLLARWRVGRGWTLAWTTDLEASPWVRWSGFSPFWGGLVREHLRRRERGRELRAEVVDGQLHAQTDALGPDLSFDDALDSSVELSGPEPEGARRLLPIRQTAPGRYEAWFPLAEAHGRYVLRIAPVALPAGGDAPSEGRLRSLSPRAVQLELPAHQGRREPTALAPDLDKLEGIAKAGGGEFGPASLPRLLDPAGQSVEVRDLLWPRLVQLALGVLLLEAMLRIVLRARTRARASGAS